MTDPTLQAGQQAKTDTAVCRCGHAKTIHEFEDEGAVSCCMARVWVSSVGAGEPRHCMCPGYEPSLTPYGHCSGCTDPDPFGGTHCEGTIEHPLAVPAPVPRATQRVPSRECMLLAHAGCKGCGCSCHDVGAGPSPAPPAQIERPKREQVLTLGGLVRVMYDAGEMDDYLAAEISRLEAEKQDAHTEGWNAAIDEAADTLETTSALYAKRVRSLSKPTAAKQGYPS